MGTDALVASGPGVVFLVAGNGQGDREVGCQGENIQSTVTEWEGKVTGGRES